jgi:cytochrome c-type biogenesis protein CcmE
VKKAYIIAFLVIGVAAGFTLWAFSGSMTPYVDIATARRSATPVQVRGKILHETAYYDKNANALRFQIEDVNKERIEVVYRGGKPDAFDTAPETAATGLVRKDATGSEIFESDKLVVKCPSKYDGNKNYYQANAGGGRK